MSSGRLRHRLQTGTELVLRCALLTFSAPVAASAVQLQATSAACHQVFRTRRPSKRDFSLPPTRSGRRCHKAHFSLLPLLDFRFGEAGPCRRFAPRTLRNKDRLCRISSPSKATTARDGSCHLLLDARNADRMARRTRLFSYSSPFVRNTDPCECRQLLCTLCLCIASVADYAFQPLHKAHFTFCAHGQHPCVLNDLSTST